MLLLCFELLNLYMCTFTVFACTHEGGDASTGADTARVKSEEEEAMDVD